ncbi:DUF5068 domain-containing protein [Sporosarcina sp. Marseille-Q4063]|uniref:DUF5068 domain-containing protein n=1 Tax=Sporosarcina sp. Marseille-Q4063 TaxID=2810514 RepID=UPI001BAF0930|nr:DUF5068 domain-containing protein [Sporosarcina sp. Marseille-Q4063]QUW20596.1 DUF5068 domain-containing protein [Sporosarcina sp. Marseille-Q4063]
MKRKNLFIVGLLSLILLVGACSDTKKEDTVEAEEKPEDIEETETEIEKEEEVENEEVAASSDGEMLNTYLAEETGGDIEVVMTNLDPGLAHAYSDDVKITIDEYQVVHVTNMNESAKTSFNDEDEGYVLTYKLTLDNQSDEDISFDQGVLFYSDDATEHLPGRSHFVARDEWLKDDSKDSFGLYSKGSFTGLSAHMITKAQFEKLESPRMTISTPYLDEDTSKGFGDEAVFFFPITEEGTKKAEATSKLYADKMVTESIADKELFFSKEDINEEQSIDDVKVTLEGVQYATVTPTAAHADRFSNFGDGPLVGLTIKLSIENGSDALVSKTIKTSLHLDQNRGTMLSNGMLEPTASGEIEPGETHEALIVYLFREDEFNLLKELEFQVGPLVDENVKNLFKEKSVTFDLPVE